MDKAKLTATRDKAAKTTEVPVEAGTVVVRALTRAEVLACRKLGNDPALFERRMLNYAMVDPEMAEKDIQLWQENSPALEIEDVIDAVMDISGLKERAEKSAYKSASG